MPNKLFLAGVFCRLKRPYFANTRANGKVKIGLHEDTLKNYHCPKSVSNSTSSSIESEEAQVCVASHNQSSTWKENEFERELDLIERRRLSDLRTKASDELDKMTQELNKNIEKMI